MKQFLNTYFKKHIENMGVSFFQKPYQIIKDMEIMELLEKMNEQSKDIIVSDFLEEYQEEDAIVRKMPTIQWEERIPVFADAF